MSERRGDGRRLRPGAARDRAGRADEHGDRLRRGDRHGRRGRPPGRVLVGAGDARPAARGHRRLRPGVRRVLGARRARRRRLRRARAGGRHPRRRQRRRRGARVGRGQRRPDDRAALQPERGVTTQGLRRLRRPRAGRGPPADGAHAAHRITAPLAASGTDDPAHRTSGPAAHGPRRAAHRGRGRAASLPGAGHAPPPPRPAARRQRLDGAVRACTAAVRAGRRRRSPSGRGVRPRHPARRASRASSGRATPTSPSAERPIE